MFKKGLYDAFVQSHNKTSPAHHIHRKARQLGVESLEPRRMMAGDIDFFTISHNFDGPEAEWGVDSDEIKMLRIEGEQLNDKAEITFDEDEIHVDLWAERQNGSLDHSSRNIEIDPDDNQITIVAFAGYGGDDVLTVDGTFEGDTQKAMLLFKGHEGNDTFLDNTSIKNWALGGAGDDTLQSGRDGGVLWGDEVSGTDFIFGGELLANDSELTDTGIPFLNDWFQPEDVTGNDTIFGGTAWRIMLPSSCLAAAATTAFSGAPAPRSTT